VTWDAVRFGERDRGSMLPVPTKPVGGRWARRKTDLDRVHVGAAGARRPEVVWFDFGMAPQV